MSGVVDGGRASVTNLSTSIQTHKAGCGSSQPLEAFFFSESSVSFVGSRSMVSFEYVHELSGLTRPLYCAFDRERNGGDDLDEYFRHSEKKRKLTVDQVQFLEKSFEVENKLEPERKIQLAKDLGLQPRHVAIWFQNRRARLKTKQVDKDYETLKASYDTLKSDYDNLVKEKNKLKAEVESLSKELLLGQTENGTSSEKGTLSQESQEKQVGYSASEGEVSKLSILACKQEDLSAAKSEMFDSESQPYTDGVQSSLLEAIDSSYAFEPDHSQLSQDEDDNMSKSILPPYVFPKLEDVDCSNTPASFEDHAFWSWSY